MVEKDDDVPEDSQSLLVITKDNYGELVIIKTEELRAKFNQVVEEGIKEKESQVEDVEILGETTENA